MQAIEAVLSACAAGFQVGGEPVWLFINGPSGCGKTTMVIDGCSLLPNSAIMGQLTTNTFLSGYTGKKNASLLHQLANPGILLFKDFTTILSMRDEARKDLIAQMREIFDGYFFKRTGSSETQEWYGKLTFIAATTPIVERYWNLTRDMGDRFIQVRWPSLDGRKIAQASRKQQGHEQDISATHKQNIYDFFTSPAISYPPPDVTDAQSDQLASMAVLCSILRCKVERDPMGAREIREIPQPEQTGRLGKSLPMLARYHASLFGSPVVGPDDIAIARRVAMDSIPYMRMLIMNAIPIDAAIPAIDVMRLLGISQPSMEWVVDELVALNMLITCDSGSLREYRLSEFARELWEVAFPS